MSFIHPYKAILCIFFLMYNYVNHCRQIWFLKTILFEEKRHKTGKTIENNYLKTRTFENSSIVETKSVTTTHPKASHKLFKTIREPKKVSQVIAGGKNSEYLLEFCWTFIEHMKIYVIKKCKKNETISCL